jgi:hypothetical protein
MKENLKLENIKWAYDLMSLLLFAFKLHAQPIITLILLPEKSVSSPFLTYFVFLMAKYLPLHFVFRIYFFLFGAHNHIEAVVTTLEKGRGQRPILVKFITFSKKFEVLENTMKSACTRIMIKSNNIWEVRQKGRELVPYLKEIKRYKLKVGMSENDFFSLRQD